MSIRETAAGFVAATACLLHMVRCRNSIQQASNRQIAEKMSRTLQLSAAAEARLADTSDEYEDPAMEITCVDVTVLSSASLPEHTAELEKLRDAVFSTGFFLIRNLPDFDPQKVSRLRELIMEINRLSPRNSLA